MIVYGWRAVNVKNGQLINADCPNCETNTSMKYSIFAKYGHVYWIPFFPYSKITVAECNSCKKTFEYKDLPESIQTKFQRIKQQHPVRYPIWMFSGIFLILALIGFGFYDSNKTDLNNAEYIKSPKAGDVYYISLSNGHFSTVRVDKVLRTEVFVTTNDYEVDRESGIDELDVAQNYTTSKDTLTYFDIQEAFKTKKITEVKRD